MSQSSSSRDASPSMAGRVPVHAPQAVARALREEMVVLHTKTEEYFTLNEVGARIWELIDGQRTPAMIAQSLIEEYDVSPEELAGDVDSLLTSLAGAHLITWTERDA